MSSRSPTAMRSLTSGSLSVAESLTTMMDRFTAASARLSERHDSLAAEIESLRERLRVKDEELARAERLSTLGATAAALAHEVRNPLGSIRLFISLLREDTRDNPGARKLIDAIDLSVSNLDHVVNNMLQFAADKPCRMQPCTPLLILSDLAKQFMAEHAELDVVVEGSDDVRVMFDESALKQIVTNLWRNAGQAMKWKGRVCTAIWMENEFWGITIRDGGPGIPESLLMRLFDPFVTGRQEGTGLGLAIVRRLVEQHRGTVTARNAETGAIFDLRFLKGVI